MIPRLSNRDRRRLAGRVALFLLGLAALSAAAAVWVFVSGHPSGRHYELQRAVVNVDAQRSGEAAFTENISFLFNGEFHGAYRDIPLRAGEAITNIQVSEGGALYQPGASAVLGSPGEPGTFGVDTTDPTNMRIVWHFDAIDQPKTFTISYNAQGSLGRGPDYALSQYKPWGSSFQYPLGTLESTLLLPRGVKPADVDAYVHLEKVGGPATIAVDQAPDGRTRVHLFASDVPAKRGVEVLAVAPAAALDSSAEVPRVDRSKASLLAGEQMAKRIQDKKIGALERAHENVIARTSVWIIVAAVVALLWLIAVFRMCGSEREVPGVPERLTEPPNDLPPLFAASLTAQLDQPHGQGLSATIFDLIRRGYYATLPATSGRNGGVVDLAIKQPRTRPPIDGLTSPERAVLDLLDPVVTEDGIATGDLADALKADVTRSRLNFANYKAAAAQDVRAQQWHTSGGLAMVLLAIPSVILLLLAVGTTLSLTMVPPLERAQDAGRAVALAAAALVLVLGMFERRVLVRRRQATAELGAKWDAFRRYLEEYGHLEHEQPASLSLWEKYLVYGIAFGCAADIAKQFANTGLLDTPAGQGSMFGGLTALDYNMLAFASLGSSLGSAAAPPAPEASSGDSGWSGGGGGFGGGGGGGFGGGGGGAW